MSADLDLAERAARAAGDVLLSRYGRPPEGLAAKSTDTDPVSDADREAEWAIHELLRSERPDDGLLSEEGAHAETASGRRWVVDPLDGTVNYLYGFPVWAVSVALEDDAGSALAVVLDPVRDECFSAVRGGGARLAGAPLHVRRPADLGQALVGTGFAYDPVRRAQQAGVVRRLLPRVRDIRRVGAAALELAWIASGRMDAYYERGLNRWDWAAGRLLVTEAGGVVTALEGEPEGLLAAATPDLLRDLAALVD